MPRAIPDYRASDLDYLNALHFPRFTTDDAVSLGLVAVSVIREWNLSLAVDVVLGDDLVFRAKLKATGPGNNAWLAGKAAVARHFGEPSLQVRLRHAEAGTRFEDLTEFDHETYKAHGGSIPIRVGGEIVGTITTSGEPDAVDHEVAAEAIRRYLSVPQ